MAHLQSLKFRELWSCLWLLLAVMLVLEALSSFPLVGEDLSDRTRRRLLAG